MGQLVKRPKRPEDSKLTTSLVDHDGNQKTTSYAPFIQSNGGDYFFSPSLSLLRELAGAPQPGQGKRKRSDSCSYGPTVVYAGKFSLNRDGAATVDNENTWAIFPRGQTNGSPVYIMSTLTKNNDQRKTEKVPFCLNYKAVRIAEGSDTFETRGTEVEASGDYDFLEYIDGKWSDGGKTLELVLRDHLKNEVGKCSLARQ